MYGTGANGKTTLANVMQKLLGDFASTAGNSLLMHRDSRNATNDLAGLRGARLVTVSEFDDGEKLAESTIKSITGGIRFHAVSCMESILSTPQHIKSCCWVITSRK
jgi:putative DNA primase/helicase